MRRGMMRSITSLVSQGGRAGPKGVDPIAVDVNAPLGDPAPPKPRRERDALDEFLHPGRGGP
eukprot:1237112-Pyramimonas_sp.AAC.1